jgi:hypothetical protein
MCSIFIKWIPAFFYVLSSIQRFRRREPLGLAGAAVALVALTAFSWALYGWTWLHAVTHLGTTGIWLTSFGTRIVLDDIGVADHTSHQITTFATFAVLAFFAWTAWRKRLHLGLAAGVLLAVAPSIEPWYVVWCVSLSAVDDEDRWGRILSVVLSGWLLSDVLTSLLHG